MLPQRVEPTGNEVVLLFTDGQANRGLTSTAAITDAVRRTWGRLVAPAVHTFGFGSDHNEDMLRSVAASNKGMYYFIGNGGEIPAAFADCLGGLTSIVARRLQLVVEVPRPLPHAVEVLEVVTKYSVKTVEAGAKFEVTIPDLYSEEQRDVVFRLRRGLRSLMGGLRGLCWGGPAAAIPARLPLRCRVAGGGQVRRRRRRHRAPRRRR